MKKCIAVAAFAVIFLSALFLFMRNYPSDRWFSGVFVVAGGVLAWCAGTETESVEEENKKIYSLDTS